MFNLIHPALAKAAALDTISHRRTPVHHKRSTRRFALRRAAKRHAAQPAEATQPRTAQLTP